MLQSQHNMQVGVLLFAATFIFASTLIGAFYARLSTYKMKQTSTLAQVSNNYGYRVSEAPLHAQLINVNCSICLHLAICATPPEGIAIQYDLTTFALTVVDCVEQWGGSTTRLPFHIGTELLLQKGIAGGRVSS